MPTQTTGALSGFLQQARVRAVLPHLDGHRLLDIGCGDGALAAHVDPARYTGIDRDRDALREARQRHPGHRFLHLDDFAREPGSFDVLVALAVIEHVPDPSGWAAAWRPSMAGRSRLVLTTPHPTLRWAHELGARVGLFSREAADEHETMLDRQALASVAEASGLTLRHYRRFLGGANQLCVMTRD